MLTDTHSHLYADTLQDDLEAVMQRCKDHGVDRIFLPNIDLESIDPMVQLEKAYPENCFAMMGLHPCSVDHDFQASLATIRSCGTKALRCRWRDRHRLACNTT